jgi:hypothetical protein
MAASAAARTLSIAALAVLTTSIVCPLNRRPKPARHRPPQRIVVSVEGVLARKMHAARPDHAANQRGKQRQPPLGRQRVVRL